jgi:antitoxin component of MazEF toxin-antitoxin module
MIQATTNEVTEMAQREFRKAFLLGGSTSIAMTLPAEFLEALKIKPKTNLRVELQGKRLVVTNADDDSEQQEGAA